MGGHPYFCAAAPYSREELVEFFGTERPTRAAVEASHEHFEPIMRGQARYVVLYEGDRPTEIYFVGYSYD